MTATEPQSSDPTPRVVDGASAERTRLAWRRTALSTTAVTLLTVRLAVRDGVSVATGVAIAAAVAGWLTATLSAQRRIGSMTETRPRHIGRSLPVTALATVGFAVLGIVLVVARS